MGKHIHLYNTNNNRGITMNVFKSIDNFIIATAEKMIEILDSDIFAFIIVTLAVLGILFQFIRTI